MPLKIIHHHHTEVMGSGRVLLSSPHVESSRRDLQTRQIVEEAALLSKSWAIIAKANSHKRKIRRGLRSRTSTKAYKR